MRASPSYNVVQLLKYSRFLHNIQLLDTKSDILKLYPLVIRRSRIDDEEVLKDIAHLFWFYRIWTQNYARIRFLVTTICLIYIFVDCQDAIPALKHTNGDKEPACER